MQKRSMSGSSQELVHLLKFRGDSSSGEVFCGISSIEKTDAASQHRLVQQSAQERRKDQWIVALGDETHSAVLKKVAQSPDGAGHNGQPVGHRLKYRDGQSF